MPLWAVRLARDSILMILSWETGKPFGTIPVCKKRNPALHKFLAGTNNVHGSFYPVGGAGYNSTRVTTAFANNI